MYTGGRREAHTYARCLRTLEGSSSLSGEAMVAEVVGCCRKRRTQPRARRSRSVGGQLRGRRGGDEFVLGGRRQNGGRRAGSRSSLSRSTMVRRSKQSRQLEVCLLGLSSHNGMATRQSQPGGCMRGRPRLRVFKAGDGRGRGRGYDGVVVLRIEVGGGRWENVRETRRLFRYVCCSPAG